MSSVLVTGGSGLVGSALKNICQDYKDYKWTFLTSKDCDLRDYNSTLETFSKHRPDYVIHLAANVGGLYKNITNSLDMFEDNTLININVLRVSRLLKVKRVISFLSTCIYPDKTTYPIQEDYINDGPPHPSNEGYSYSKRILEIYTRLIKKQEGIDWVSIVPTNIYGENDNFNLEDGHVVPVLIHKMYKAQKEGKDLNILGDGQALRQFLYSGDVARIILLLLSKEKLNHQSYIISPKEEYSIRDFVTKLINVYDFKGGLVYDTSRPSGQLKKTCDNSRLIGEFPDFKFTPIDKGLENTVRWFIENYSSARK